MVGNKRDQIWFVHDVCGMVCCVFTWVLIAYAQYSVVTCIILPERDTLYKTINLIVFEALLFLSVVSHFKCGRFGSEQTRCLSDLSRSLTVASPLFLASLCRSGQCATRFWNA